MRRAGLRFVSQVFRLSRKTAAIAVRFKMKKGITMRKTALPALAILALSAGVAAAAEMPAKAYTKAPPVVVSPWDIAFGAGIANDYIFRGITQSNHKPSVNAYFEPRYNINPNLQLYAGLAGSSISFPNRAAAEIDGYFGIRPTFGALALDAGFWYYGYPGGQTFAGTVIPQNCTNGNVIPAPVGIQCNVMKGNVSFYEVYGKATYTVNDFIALGGNVYYTPSFLNSGAPGTYASATAKFTAPSTMLPNGLGAYVSGEFGRQWLGVTDAFYGNINLADYNTWNIGVGFTWKVFTLDLRYSDTNLNKGDCNAFTSDHTTTATSAAWVTAANPSGVGSNWCGSAFIAKLSVDTSASALK
jgi:hypothetical protein